MKTAKYLLKEHFDNFDHLQDFEVEELEKAMKEYAEQTLQRASEVAEGDVTWLRDDLHELQYGEEFEIGVSRQSILQVKNELR